MFSLPSHSPFSYIWPDSFSMFCRSLAQNVWLWKEKQFHHPTTPNSSTAGGLYWGIIFKTKGILNQCVFLAMTHFPLYLCIHLSWEMLSRANQPEGGSPPGGAVDVWYEQHCCAGEHAVLPQCPIKGRLSLPAGLGLGLLSGVLEGQAASIFHLPDKWGLPEAVSVGGAANTEQTLAGPCPSSGPWLSPATSPVRASSSPRVWEAAPRFMCCRMGFKGASVGSVYRLDMLVTWITAQLSCILWLLLVQRWCLKCGTQEQETQPWHQNGEEGMERLGGPRLETAQSNSCKYSGCCRALQLLPCTVTSNRIQSAASLSKCPWAGGDRKRLCQGSGKPWAPPAPWRERGEGEKWDKYIFTPN